MKLARSLLNEKLEKTRSIAITAWDLSNLSPDNCWHLKESRYRSIIDRQYSVRETAGNTYERAQLDGQKTAANWNRDLIDQTDSYRPLVRVPDSVYWTADGDLNGLNSVPANFLKLSAFGGVPGAPEGDFREPDNSLSRNGFDRFVIAAYTIDRTGNYSISDSHFVLAGNSIDGVEVQIRVNDDAPVMTKTIDADESTQTAAGTNFDTSLGYLSKDDKIYVAFGPRDNQNTNFFFTDFTIYRTSHEIKVADFVDDFTGNGSLAAGWEYFWNAPHGWQAGQSLGDLQTGSLSDLDSFQRLQPAGQAGFWTADGDRLEPTMDHPISSDLDERMGSRVPIRDCSFRDDSTGQSVSYRQNGLIGMRLRRIRSPTAASTRLRTAFCGRFVPTNRMASRSVSLSITEPAEIQTVRFRPRGQI